MYSSRIRWYYPDEFKPVSPLTLLVPAISVIARRAAPDEPFIAALGATLGEALTLLPKETILTFLCAQSCFSNSSAVVRAKRLWNSSDLLRKVHRAFDEAGGT